MMYANIHVLLYICVCVYVCMCVCMYVLGQVCHVCLMLHHIHTPSAVMSRGLNCAIFTHYLTAARLISNERIRSFSYLGFRTFQPRVWRPLKWVGGPLRSASRYNLLVGLLIVQIQASDVSSTTILHETHGCLASPRAELAHAFSIRGIFPRGQFAGAFSNQGARKIDKPERGYICLRKS